MELPIIELEMYGEMFGLYREFAPILNFNIRLISDKIIENNYNEPYSVYINFENIMNKNHQFKYFRNFFDLNQSKYLSMMNKKLYYVVELSMIDIVCKQELLKLKNIMITCDYILNFDKKIGIVNSIKEFKILIDYLIEYNEKLPGSLKKKYTEYFV